VETVSNLNGGGRSSSCGFGVLAATISVHYFNPWMLLESPSEGVRAPIRKNIHQPFVFEIHQNSPIASAPTEGKVVDTEGPRRLAIPEPYRADVVQ
jgi:hypothetical protein